MSSGEWIPLIAQQYVSYTWDYSPGTVLQKNQVLEVTITVAANQYVTGVEDFTDNLYIIATKA